MNRASILAFGLVFAAACSDPPQKTPRDNGANNGSNNGTSNGTNIGTTGGTNNTVAPDGPLDLLFVIDNSGSMCQEQREIGNNASRLFQELADAEIDFQVGITTTHMNADYPLEPLAQPGQLQSTPQPIPGFDRSCHTAADSDGNPVPGDYAPVRAALQAAVACMAVPDESYLTPSNADIECALYNMPQGCSISSGAGCEAGSCEPASLFPPASSYRAIPSVIRSSDYMSASGLDVDRLSADFACAAFTGTRGYGIEKGLAAAILATSPQLTGGTPQAPVDPAAPNHGLIRNESRFGLVFVTDENDCSHDGSLDERSVCGGDVCEFANSPTTTSSPLLDVGQLKSDLLENLRLTKGLDELSPDSVYVASLHGTASRYEGPARSEEECASETYDGIDSVCGTSLGKAYSGDRYERFLSEFLPGQTYPPADEPVGWMCESSLAGALDALGAFFAGE